MKMKIKFSFDQWKKLEKGLPPLINPWKIFFFNLNLKEASVNSQLSRHGSLQVKHKSKSQMQRFTVNLAQQKRILTLKVQIAFTIYTFFSHFLPPFFLQKLTRSRLLVFF